MASPLPRHFVPLEFGHFLSARFARPKGDDRIAQGFFSPDLYRQVALSGEAATHESLGRSPRNRATKESSAEGAAQIRG